MRLLMVMIFLYCGISRIQGARNYWQQLWVLVGNSWGEDLKGLVFLFFFDAVRYSY